ncbi:hypothetical protein [Tsuneonella sp. HG222]
MDADRIAHALARIDAAARRIEAAASRPAVLAGDPALEQRHARLVNEAGAALADLDRLIGSLEP